MTASAQLALIWSCIATYALATATVIAIGAP